MSSQIAQRVLTSLKITALLGGIGLLMTSVGRLQDGFKWRWDLDGWLLVAIANFFVVGLFIPISPDTRPRAEWRGRKKPRKARR